MRKSTRIVIWTVGILLILLCFLLVVPSLIGGLMAVMLIFAVADFSSRRYRSTVRTFNSAIRAVCHYDGAIGKVALAFSRSGPLSGPCYEYARRLMMGEDPVDAAVSARVPLQLQTAIAIRCPEADVLADKREREFRTRELATIDSTMMPVYGQFIYLTAAAMVTCGVLAFMGVFIVPTLESMFDEFGLEMRHRALFSVVPAIWILGMLAFIGVVVVPLLNRGHLFGIRLPNAIPTMPRLAERKAEMLYGLADGIDAGWPMGRSLATGHAISTGSLERRSLERAMYLIEGGTDPMEAIQRVGWIDADEQTWLTGTSPARTAELLRSIADQTIRDARSNLKWLMAFVFPVLVLLLGAAVMAYAYGFFATMSELINGLS